MLWDLFVLVLLIFISITVPYRISFSDGESKPWFVCFTTIDIFFVVDILLTFNTSFSDEEAKSDIYSRKAIAINYVKGWLIIDVLSVIPFDFFFQGGEVSSLAKFARIGRLYKIIRMTRLAKLFKILKSKDKFQS